MGASGGVDVAVPASLRVQPAGAARALDLGTIQAAVEADAPRETCRIHGVTDAAVPWARHGAGHTRAFDDQVACLTTVTSSAAALMRIAWRTVRTFIARARADTETAFE